jgi:hypothetical protein
MLANAIFSSVVVVVGGCLKNQNAYFGECALCLLGHPLFLFFPISPMLLDR